MAYRHHNEVQFEPSSTVAKQASWLFISNIYTRAPISTQSKHKKCTEQIFWRSFDLAEHTREKGIKNAHCCLKGYLTKCAIEDKHSELKRKYEWSGERLYSEHQHSHDRLTDNSETNNSSAACENEALTAGPATEHGHRLKHHLVKEQCHRFVVKLVLQKVAVVVDVSSLTGDRHSL